MGFFHHSQAVQLLVEAGAAQPHFSGCFADISTASPENPGQIGPLESLRGGLQRVVPELLGQGGLVTGSRENRGGTDTQDITDVTLGNHIVGYDHKHALDYIAQFPDISRPAVVLKGGKRSPGKLFMGGILLVKPA